MNYHNFSQKTNFIGGSDKFENMIFYMTTANIPGVTFTHPEIGGRFSSKVYLASDTMSHNNLSFEFLIDEDFLIYKDFMRWIKLSFKSTEGTFNDEPFTFWLQINNSKGNAVLNFEFYNCRIENIGDINLNVQEDTTEHTMSVDIKFDYFEIVEHTTMKLSI